MHSETPTGLPRISLQSLRDLCSVKVSAKGVGASYVRGRSSLDTNPLCSPRSGV